MKAASGLPDNTVLLVEDDPATAELERRALVRAGATVRVATGVADALAILEHESFSAILLDYNLPDGDPWSVVEAATSRVPRIPVVLVTAMGNERVAAEALHRGVAEYVKKAESFWDQLPGVVDRVAKLAQVEEALRGERLQLAEAQRIAHVGSWDWELRTNQVTSSEELHRIFGLEKGATIGSFEELLDRIHVEDRDRVRESLQAASRDEQPVAFEYRIVRPDGEIRNVDAKGQVFVDDEGQVIRMAGTVHDVSLLKEMQKKLVFADRMASVGTMAAGVAHEINNPLSYVVANLDMIAQELVKLSSEFPSSRLRYLAEFTDDARHGADRIRKIVRGMKTFSRADDERRTVLDVRSVLELSINLVFNEIRHRARLVKDFGDVPPVEADEARLGQVFINLLVNAAHALPDGSADVHEIRLVTKTDSAGRAVVEVRDTGTGIPHEMLGRIFDPFFTTKPIGVGTGLGLSICHGIVSALGGEIVAESALGRGSVFRVVLPPAKLAVAATSHHPPATPTAGKVARILIVDDDPIVGRAIGNALEEHEAVFAMNGKQALHLLTSGERFDVILCDLMMPVMSGPELYAELGRSMPEQLDRMIFITGGAFTPTARAFLDRVPNERLEKPFDVQNLRALIQRMSR